jgi:hypothetical protein
MFFYLFMNNIFPFQAMRFQRNRETYLSSKSRNWILFSKLCWSSLSYYRLGYVTTSITRLAWKSISSRTTILAWNIRATSPGQLIFNLICSGSLSRHGRCRRMDGNRDGSIGTPRTAHSGSLEATGKQESRWDGMAVVTYLVNCPPIELPRFSPLWIAQVCSHSTPTSTSRC